MNFILYKMEVLDALFQKLEITPKIYKPISYQQPDFHQYPVEFDYLARCLYQFGPCMAGYKLLDLNSSGWLECFMYAIHAENLADDWNSRGQRIRWVKIPMEFMGQNMQTISELVGVRILILGPDEQQVTLIDGISEQERNETIGGECPVPYVVLFHSYENLWYPLVSLDKRQTNLFYREKDEFLSHLLSLINPPPSNN